MGSKETYPFTRFTTKGDTVDLAVEQKLKHMLEALEKIYLINTTEE